MSTTATLRAPAVLESRLRILLLCAVLVSMGVFGVAERNAALGIGMALVATAGWVVTEVVTGGRGGMPRWVSAVVLTGMLVAAGLRIWSGDAAAVSSFSTFLGAILAVKMWERRQRRDHAQILTLSLFLTIGATLTDTGLWVGIGVAGMAVILLFGVMTYQVALAADRAGGAACVAWRDVRRGVVGLGAAMLVGIVPLAAVVFVSLPRGVGFERFGAVATPGSRRATGFADEVNLNQGGLISQSHAKAFEVLLRDGATGRPIEASGEQQYFRGAVLTRYERGVWKRDDAPNLTRTTMQSGHFQQVSPSDAGEAEVSQTYFVRGAAPTDTPLFALYRPTSLVLGLVEQAVQVTIDLDTYELQRQTASGGMTYTVRSVATDPRSPWLAAVEEARSRRGLVTHPSERIRALAKDVLERSDLAFDAGHRPVGQDATAARRLESFLRLGYRYTLEGVPAPLGEDPTEHFLFVSKQGHCEHFASALAAMCRAAGIDARVVAGYMTSEFDAESGRYVARANHAHAWVEVNTSPGLWQVYDATPPGQLQMLRSPGRGVMAGVSRWLEALEEAWNTSIATFDEQKQARLFGERRAGGSDAAWIPSWPRAWRWSDRGASSAVWPWVVAGVGIVGVVFAWKRLAWVRRPGKLGTGWALTGRARAAASRLDRTLARLGHARPKGAPLLAWTEGVEGELGRAPADMARLVYRASFGGESIPAEAWEEAGRRVDSLRVRGS